MTQYFGYPSHEDFQSHRDSLDAEEWFAIGDDDGEGALRAQHTTGLGDMPPQRPSGVTGAADEARGSIPDFSARQRRLSDPSAHPEPAEFCWPSIDDVEWDVRLAYNRDTARYEQLRSAASGATPNNPAASTE